MLSYRFNHFQVSKVRLDEKSATVGTKLSDDSLEVRNDATTVFASVRTTVSVSLGSNRVYVILWRKMVLWSAIKNRWTFPNWMGNCRNWFWCQSIYSYGRSNSVKGGRGVGDDDYSYACDLNRLKRWHGGEQNYGTLWTSVHFLGTKKWKVGDVIGCSLDLDKKIMAFSLNGEDLGTAFTNVR